MTRTLVFDNEAVQALADPRHRKHRRALALVQATVIRRRRRAGAVRLVVPTAVRVEAGWNRQAPRAAVLNRLQLDDMPLDSDFADRAAAIRTALGVSVADAHLAAVLQSTAGPHAVLTSDTDDLDRIGGHLGITLNVVPL